MSGLRLFVRVFACLAATISLAAPSPALADSSTGRHWHESFVFYKLSTTIPDDWAIPIFNADTEWRNFTPFNIAPDHITVIDSTEPATGDHLLWKGTIPSAWQSGCPPNVTLACTRTWTDSLTGHITDGDIVFNGERDDWTTNDLKCFLALDVDVQAVALHEFGHLGGLGHDSDTETVMYGSYITCRRELTTTDVESMQNNYPGH
jgi:hypothetical protein